MPVVDDWDIDYALEQLAHIDGVLSYDANAGTAPAKGDYVRGTTNGAVGKILAGSDLGGTSATGTFTLTEVIGRFQDNEPIEVLSVVNFDGIGNGGFVVGDILDDTASARITVAAIEYNWDPALPGEGDVHGHTFTTGFVNDDVIDINGGVAAVALVHTGAETDNSGLFGSALCNGEMKPPGTVNTNESVIIHFDAGTAPITIPERASIEDATSTATGVAQQVLGDTSTGSIRVVDSNDSGGAWADSNTLRLTSVVNYDVLTAGQVFNVNDVVVGSVSAATGRVLAVIILTSTTGRLILANETGTWDAATPDLMQVGGVTIAETADTTFTLDVGTLNLPNGVRTEQRTDQGGILDRAVSMNIIRDTSEVYSYSQGTWDELGQLDDDPPFLGIFKDNVYTLQKGWFMLPGSYRFMEKGAIQTDDGTTIVRGFDSIYTGVDIAANGYLATSGKPTPMPDAYVVQDGLKIAPWYVEGPFRVMHTIKTRNRVDIIDPTVNALGQLIDGGKAEWFSRPYLRLYSVFEDTQIAAGVSAIVLDNPNDGNNNTGQYIADYDAGSAATLLVGEEIFGVFGTVPNEVEYRGIVTAQTGDAGATGTVSFVLKSVQFVNNAVLTGRLSGKSLAINEPTAVDDLVAGYGDDVRTMTIDTRFTGGTTTVSTFIVGEQVSQATSGYDGYMMEDDAGSIYCQDAPGTAAPNATGQLSGDVSGALNTPTGTNDQATVPKDIGDGSGDLNYDAVTSGDITGASAQPIANVYEWDKFITRKEEETLLQGGPSTVTGIIGAIYRKLDATFDEVKTAPYGTKPGALMFGAQGHFIDKDTLIAADLQNIQLIDNAGTTVNPPNLQTLQITNLVSGDRVAAYRTSAPASTVIQRSEFDVGTVGGGNNQSADSTILVGANDRTVGPLANDVPDIGHLYVLDPNNTGIYLRFPYNAVNRTTNVFTLTSGTIGAVTGSQDLTLDDNVHVAFIVEQSAGASVSNTIQYDADINIFYVARVKGIIPFEGTGTFGTGGATLPATRSADTVVELP